MAKVYVSSALVDLESEREAAMDWLTRANHQPAHSYVPDTQTVREGCLKDVRDCEAHVPILGFGYGHIPTDGNPQGLSVPGLEYREAVVARLPIIVLSSKGIRDVAVTDINKPEYAKVDAFARLVN